ncbi:MAG: hypothetical protein WCK65_13190 [Rhodospirillaceae bacterium]
MEDKRGGTIETGPKRPPATNKTPPSRGWFSGGARDRVLVIGEGVSVLFRIERRKVILEHKLPLLSEVDLDEFTAYLVKRRTRLFHIVLNGQEQSYRSESLPPVAWLDRGKVLKRRLQNAFSEQSGSGTVFKGALFLSPPKSGEGARYLFAGVSDSNIVEDLVSRAEAAGLRVIGPSMLPIEVVGLVEALVKAVVAGKVSAGSGWLCLILCEVGGSFRQIITRNGELMLTRYNEHLEESGPELIASEMRQAFAGTLDYLSRIGYSTAQGLDAVVICPEAVGAELGDMPTGGGVFAQHLTPKQAAEIVGLRLDDAETASMGESVCAGWVARRKNPRLKLTTPAIIRTQQQNLAGNVVMLTGLLAMAVVGIEVGLDELRLIVLRSDTEIAVQRVASLNTELAQVKSDNPAGAGALESMQAMLDLNRRMNFADQAFHHTVVGVARALPPSLRLTQLAWEQHLVESTGPKGAGRQSVLSERRPGTVVAVVTADAKPKPLGTQFTVDLAPTPEENRPQMLQTLRGALGTAFPGYEILVGEPEAPLDEKPMVIGSGSLIAPAAAVVAKAPTAIVSLRGDKP